MSTSAGVRPQTVLLIGGGSYIGQAVAQELIVHGTAVSALARSPHAESSFRSRGVTPVPGALGDVAALCASLDFDSCVWLASLPWRDEWRHVRAALEAMPAGRSFVFTSGTSVLGEPAPDGRWSENSFTETDSFVPPPWAAVRRATERAVLDWPGKITTMVVRPPLVWGHGGSRQVPWVFEAARRIGASPYVGAGLNVYSHVHVDDLASVFRLALERGSDGATYHAVAGEENFRAIADAVARVLGCATRRVSLEQMGDQIGRTEALVGFGINSRSRARRTRAELGWEPKHPDLVDDITNGSYSLRRAR